MTDSHGAPTAGWYTDPADAAQLRWWNGGGWTHDVRPVAPPMPEVAAVEHAPQPVAAAAAAAQPTAEPAPLTRREAVRAAEPDPEPVGVAPGFPAQTAATPGFPPQATPTELPDHIAAAAAQRSAVVGAHYEAPTRWVGSASTPGVWLLACSPIIGAVVVTGAAYLLQTVGLVIGSPRFLTLLVVPLVLWFARMDRGALAARGYEPPAAGWVLLTPLAYLIARAIAVRRAGGSSWGPIAAYVAQCLVVVAAVAAAFVLAASYLTGLFGFDLPTGVPTGVPTGTTQSDGGTTAEPPAVAALMGQAEQLITIDLETDGQVWSTDCSMADGAQLTDVELHVTCIATDGAGVQHHIEGHIDATDTLNYTVLD